MRAGAQGGQKTESEFQLELEFQGPDIAAENAAPMLLTAESHLQPSPCSTAEKMKADAVDGTESPVPKALTSSSPHF